MVTHSTYRLNWYVDYLFLFGENVLVLRFPIPPTLPSIQIIQTLPPISITASLPCSYYLGRGYLPNLAGENFTYLLSSTELVLVKPLL